MQQVELCQCLRRVLYHGAASVRRYPLCCDGEQVFKIAAARRLLDVGVYLVLLDASGAHGLDGAAQDGKRVVLSKKPDFDVRKFDQSDHVPVFNFAILISISLIASLSV